MSDLLFDRTKAAVSGLLRLVEERRRQEGELLARFDHEEEEAQQEAGNLLAGLATRHEKALAELDDSFQREQEKLTHQLETHLANQVGAYAAATQRLDAEEKEKDAALEAELKDARWTIDSVLESGLKRVEDQQRTVEHKVAAGRELTETLWKRMEPLLAQVDLERAEVQPGTRPTPRGESLRDLQAILSKAESLVEEAEAQSLRPWLHWPVQVEIALACLIGCALPALFLRPWSIWLGGGLGVGFGLALGQRTILLGLLRRRVRRLGRWLAEMLMLAAWLSDDLLERTAAATRAEEKEIRQKHAADRHKAESRYQPRVAQHQQRVRTERQAIDANHQADMQRLQQLGEKALAVSRQRYEKERANSEARGRQALDKAQKDSADQLRAIRRERAETEQRLRTRWQQGCRHFLGEASELQQAAAPAQPSPAGLTLGTMTVDVRPLFDEPHPPDLTPWPDRPQKLPVFLPFPQRGGLLLEAQGDGKTAAVQTLQAMMLRFLTALPPGKVRFTIFDPVGLGDNFAAFMHLADHDELLVTSRIWTEPGHIEKQLADLTLHMENVIQKYLRNQFKSIEDYNQAAGEVAEPYRVLVIANFPVNCTPAACRRLLSILQSGAGCGVYTLLSVDVRQQLPQGFELAELERLCLTLRWQGNRFAWEDADLDRFPLTLEPLPEQGKLIETVRQVGARSREAGRVEVPFSFIAPKPDEVWHGDSRRGLAVPLGRAGAVRRLVLQLGRGTSQHVVVAGKTGSGKSTLWHALIINLCLHYSPDEVELYLIDFKKGVEFKLYAEHHLPHARVIAIESEREFGLSVLQRLDAELRERGDRFRSAGVNDVAGYRQAHPNEACPRVLLIIDEFQEFFTEDDRVAQEAALLLDRLVRQGRAFGLHVLLGSQTLGGAYSLARSTIDQMAVRIALQCSETDAQLILAKDNAAARLLTRPGEAIYNDASGALEGNDIFQVVWLTDADRERHLRLLEQRSTGNGKAPKPAIVFESSTPAELANNPLLRRCLAGERLRDPQGGTRAWLGEAVAIKDPTAAPFRPQGGSNLLILGQNEEAALALLASAIISLAVQHKPESARFVLLDGTGIDDPMAGYLPAVLEGWPHATQHVQRADVTATLTSLADEMNRRLKGQGERTSCYLLIHGLQRFREFRRVEDDFGFGRRGAERTLTPLENLVALLRDGPPVGIHVLTWCDQLTSLNRTLDRQGQRECGLRVLFQMSPADSSHLLDSPAAARLGRSRALFFHDEMAQPEKFRPYGLPTLAWVAELKERQRQAIAG